MTSPSRPGRDEYFLRGAEWAATRGTCLRRQVGCVLVNERGHILATGYNGVESGALHCNEQKSQPVEPGSSIIIYPNACPGAGSPSGQGLDKCNAIHAEQNALLQCGDVYQIHTCYVTHSPCIHCVKLLMGTSCKRIIFRHKYAHDQESSSKWLSKTGRVWWHIPNGSGE